MTITQKRALTALGKKTKSNLSFLYCTIYNINLRKMEVFKKHGSRGENNNVGIIKAVHEWL